MSRLRSSAFCILLLAAVSLGSAQPGLGPQVWVPGTSVALPGAAGVTAHTNHLLLAMPAGGRAAGGILTPDDVRRIYDLPSTGGSRTIAIVCAYHYPTALADFNIFSRQFDLPAEASPDPAAPTNSALQVVYAKGVKPPVDAGWSQEAALDIEWAHAMAPNARIVLVEAASATLLDLFRAVDVASRLPDVRQVSISWGTGEFFSERVYDRHFPPSNGIVYFAASGDIGGLTTYPGSSPWVVSVGGTSVLTDAAGGLVAERGWGGSGGGSSIYEQRPDYQWSVSRTTRGRRGVPDISCNADPFSGVPVYCSTSYGGWSGWMVFGGTSLSAPCMAGMVNLAGQFRSGTAAQLRWMYGRLRSGSFRDITEGRAGPYACRQGWDFVTGIGAPRGTSGL